jgi:NAD(P)-dependent dehydrogenase (short-subunit alcohol dehydrogenase family)
MSDQKTAVVTGANSGFGRLTAEALFADGWRVYGTMRNVATRNAEAAKALRASGISVVELDVTSDASVDAAAKTIHDEAGAVDVLVNNAGTAFFGIQEAFTPALAEQQFATNVFGPLRVNRAFLPAMRARKKGLIVYVSSTVGRFVFPFGGIYTASKWALEALAETSYYELTPFGIDVAIVEPGAYATEIGGKATSPDDTERVNSYGDAAALMETLFASLGKSMEGRDASEVAQAILHLANAPAGTRALRTPVPTSPHMEAVNAAVAPIQRQFVVEMGLEALIPKTLV